MKKALKEHLYHWMQFYEKSMFLSAVLVFISPLILFSVSGCSDVILTISILILSTMLFLKLKWRKEILDASPVPGGVEEEPSKLTLEYVSKNESNQMVKNDEQKAASTPDLPFPWDSESSNSIMDGNFEYSLTCPELENSVVSAPPEDENDEDDDDSLIEIPLPNNLLSSLTQKPLNRNMLQSDFPDFLPDSIFNQQRLMELLAEINEMNEDESLIEIDISRGSTLCSIKG